MKLTERQRAIVDDAKAPHRLMCFGESLTCHSTRLAIRPSVRELNRLKELGAIFFRPVLDNYTTNMATGEITLDQRVVPTSAALAVLAQLPK